MLAADSEVLLDGSDFQDYVFVSVCVWDRDISLVSGFDLTDTLVPGGVAGCHGPRALSAKPGWDGVEMSEPLSALHCESPIRGVEAD